MRMHGLASAHTLRRPSLCCVSLCVSSGKLAVGVSLCVYFLLIHHSNGNCSSLFIVFLPPPFQRKSLSIFLKFSVKFSKEISSLLSQGGKLTPQASGSISTSKQNREFQPSLPTEVACHSRAQSVSQSFQCPLDLLHPSRQWLPDWS